MPDPSRATQFRSQRIAPPIETAGFSLIGASRSCGPKRLDCQTAVAAHVDPRGPRPASLATLRQPTPRQPDPSTRPAQVAEANQEVCSYSGSFKALRTAEASGEYADASGNTVGIGGAEGVFN